MFDNSTRHLSDVYMMSQQTKQAQSQLYYSNRPKAEHKLQGYKCVQVIQPPGRNNTEKNVLKTARVDQSSSRR